MVKFTFNVRFSNSNVAQSWRNKFAEFGVRPFEKLRNALKDDVYFTVFKITNKRKLQSLKYIPESRGGDTSKFISTFVKLCYNAKINDIEEQKKYLYKSLPMNHFKNEKSLKHIATGKYL
ncbi:hypothetical protein C1645_825423 [Glomus cerebriforme]|uniref:Uncharacterized protein n=1 Tax=Glomus cerebriforme TaxID=658196 RepID=A0A397SWM3_9GLOM|nr:hypothetical protein C1645_825423 [Glomus cerebriforme]